VPSALNSPNALLSEVFRNLDLELPFIIESKLAKNTGNQKLAGFLEEHVVGLMTTTCG
jgi:hypothetical protein